MKTKVATNVTTTQISPSAKNSKDSKDSKGGKKKGKSKVAKFFRNVTIICLFILFYIYWDEINLYLAPKVKDIDYLNQVFFLDPEADRFEGWSVNQLMNEIDQLELTIESNKLELAANATEIEQLNARIQTLQIFEDEYNAFIQNKTEFSFELAEANPALFVEQYENMEPDIAANIYASLINGVELTADQKAQAKTISEMDSATAAKALETMLATDTDLIQTIFNSMDTQSQASILDEMSADNAAQVIRLITPQQ